MMFQTLGVVYACCIFLAAWLIEEPRLSDADTKRTGAVLSHTIVEEQQTHVFRLAFSLLFLQILALAMLRLLSQKTISWNCDLPQMNLT